MQSSAKSHFSLSALPRFPGQTGDQIIHYKLRGLLKIPAAVLHQERPDILKKSGILELPAEIHFKLRTGNPMTFMLHVFQKAADNLRRVYVR